MSDFPQHINHSFTAPIGAQVTGETWPCVEMPGSAEFFGTGRSVRVDATIDGIAMPAVGLMVTGSGGPMLSASAAMRKRLCKDVGDEVTVHLQHRLR